MHAKRTSKPSANRRASKSSPAGPQVRLHKAMADAGVGSRRACEKMIEEAMVSVNGKIVTDLPIFVDPQTDRIEVSGRPVARPGRGPRRVYLMVNKPRNVICTNRDPQGRSRVVDLVPHTERLFCVGRLDGDSTGLVLLTNDGELCERLTHPRYEIPKTYRVTVRGKLEPEDVAKLQRGIFLADRRKGGKMRAQAERVQQLKTDRDRTELEITLREGKNREIRRMLVRLGHPVKKLRRIALGPLKLKGVASGQWRALTQAEVRSLRRAAGAARKQIDR
jgi:pseudouridine synthase